KWEVPSSCSFLQLATQTNIRSHTCIYRPHAAVHTRTRRLTPLENHVVVTASGKENSLLTQQFLQLSSSAQVVFLCPQGYLYKVYCCAVVRTTEIRKLQEVLRQLSYVKDGLQDNEKMIYTPETNEQDCCGQSALRCFRAAMKVHFNVSEKRLSMLHKSLENPLTIKGVNFCNSGNSTKTCSACDSYPKAKPKAFFNKLESFIQLAITRLSVG
ncbi:uncharacterized protein LOC112488160, partial [Cynoglossus semilaevis]|uniref:uncharacterized protein LOC112488160 n=1 Tax=Cynoglossus semilaevis TaxID=244447 RepID=UPI000D6257C7